MSGCWGVVVPVKRLTYAKSRLSSFGDARREALALAFAADVVVTATRCQDVLSVVVVTDDDIAAGLLGGLGALVVPDGPDDGLNPALEHGAALLRKRYDGAGVACLSADLPAARPHDLTAALGLVGPGARGFAADAGGSGTTLLAAGPGSPLLAAFGSGSRARHLASGAVELDVAAGLRRDVDTPDDLTEALRLGVGTHTAGAAAGLLQPAQQRGRQATVRDWDPLIGGTALRDDGSSVVLPPECLRGSAFRLLRSGQRVQLHVRDGVVMRADLPGR